MTNKSNRSIGLERCAKRIIKNAKKVTFDQKFN